LFKQETNSPKFFELDIQNYLQANANEIPEIIDPQLKAETHSLLKANGYSEKQTDMVRSAPPNSFSHRLLSKIERVLSGPSTTAVWMFLARNFPVTPPSYNFFEFASLDQAIDYARNISRGNFSRRRGSQELLNARELSKR